MIDTKAPSFIIAPVGTVAIFRFWTRCSLEASKAVAHAAVERLGYRQVGVYSVEAGGRESPPMYIAEKKVEP